jgi:hypothetical protein
MYHAPQPFSRRRRGPLIGAAVLLVLLAGGAVLAVALRSGDGDGAPAYTRRGSLCDLVDPAPLAALSLRERPNTTRMTDGGTGGGDGDDPYSACELQLVPIPAGPNESGYALRADAVFYVDAAAARAGFVDERERAESIAGATRSDAPGVGDEGFFATSVLDAETDGVHSTLTTFHVVARHRNVVVQVNTGHVRDSDWNQPAVRDALIAIVRTLLGGL